MSEQTKIQWCDDTHNFWRGCVKVSPGCANCYAEVSTPVRVARSEGRELWGGKLRDKAKDFNAPLRWNEKPFICDICGAAHHTPPYLASPSRYCGVDGCQSMSVHRRRVFSLSLGDWLDPDVPIEWLAEMLDVIRRCPNLDFLLLTKRPELWAERICGASDYCWPAKPTANTDLNSWLRKWFAGTPPANIWIGATVENQEYADKRIPELLKIPAVCRFVSYEPALGAVDFHLGRYVCRFCGWRGTKKNAGMCPSMGVAECPICVRTTRATLTRYPEPDWIIVGGESGPKARPFNVDWARSTVRQCREAGVACFVKQLGARPYVDGQGPSLGQMVSLEAVMEDKKGGDIAEFPEDLRVREWPKVEGAR